MGITAGLLGGLGGAGGGGFRPPPIAGSGQILAPSTRAAISQRREPIDPAQFEIQRQQFLLSGRGTSRTGQPTGRTFQFQQPGEQSGAVRRSQRQADFLTSDLQSAAQNRFFIDLLRGGGQGGGRQSRGGRASFLGAGSTPRGARSFPSLLRNF